MKSQMELGPALLELPTLGFPPEAAEVVAAAAVAAEVAPIEAVEDDPIAEWVRPDDGATVVSTELLIGVMVICWAPPVDAEGISVALIGTMRC